MLALCHSVDKSPCTDQIQLLEPSMPYFHSNEIDRHHTRVFHTTFCVRSGQVVVGSTEAIPIDRIRADLDPINLKFSHLASYMNYFSFLH